MHLTLGGASLLGCTLLLEVDLTLGVAEQGRRARCPGLGLEAQLAELSLGRGTRLLVTAISRLPLMTGIII